VFAVGLVLVGGLAVGLVLVGGLAVGLVLVGVLAVRMLLVGVLAVGLLLVSGRPGSGLGAAWFWYGWGSSGRAWGFCCGASLGWRGCFWGRGWRMFLILASAG